MESGSSNKQNEAFYAGWIPRTTKALASRIWLVCHDREFDAGAATRVGFFHSLRET